MTDCTSSRVSHQPNKLREHDKETPCNPSLRLQSWLSIDFSHGLSIMCISVTMQCSFSFFFFGGFMAVGPFLVVSHSFHRKRYIKSMSSIRQAGSHGSGCFHVNVLLYATGPCLIAHGRQIQRAQTEGDGYGCSLQPPVSCPPVSCPSCPTVNSKGKKY